jgi:putative transposase
VALDEMFITIGGKTHYLWRAVDQDGNVLDILVTSRRDTTAATRFFRKLLKGLEYVPRVLVTDKLGSYRAARRTVLVSVEHRQSKYLNNRAENSHQPTRQRERAMKKFSSPGGAQRFCPRSAGYHRTSGPVVTCSTPRSIAARWPTASVSRTKSPG